MVKETLLSGVFCFVAATLMAAVLSSTSPLTAQDPGDAYTSAGCGEFSGPLCKKVEVTSCVGSSCTSETSYYYYSTIIE
jgi:hypothetical protein